MRIEARALRKRFASLEALAGVSFALEPGARVALLGPNGSGKSTLNRALLGLVRCEGELRVDGRDPFVERALLARRSAYVPQSAPQLAASVAELVAAVSRLRQLEDGDVARLAARLELPLAEIAGRPFRSLSGGMRQKLLAILALAARPALLVLDEPTGSLDPGSRARLLELVADQPRATTVLLCSHRLEEVRQLASEVLVLAEGRVVRCGPLGAFLDETLRSVLELRVPPGREAALVERGFVLQGEGRFVRQGARRERACLIAELTRELGPDLLELEVHDLELGFTEQLRAGA